MALMCAVGPQLAGFCLEMEGDCEGGAHPKEVIQGVMLLMVHLVSSPSLFVCSCASPCHEMSILFHMFPPS